MMAGATAAPVFAGSEAPSIDLTQLSNTSSSGNRTVSGVVITDPDGIQTNPGLRPRLYYRELSEANAFVGNTSADNGWKYVETTDTASPFSFTLDTSLLTTPPATGELVIYFVVAQDLAVTPHVGSNGATFDSPPSSVDLQPAQAPVTDQLNAYLILAAVSGTKTVCASGCDYASLTKTGGAFHSLDSSALTGDLDLVISGDLLDEDGTSPLRSWKEDGVGGYTLTIRPDSATVRTIAGSGDFPGLIQFFGADRVVIDGRFDGSGKFLRFRNTHGSHPTIVLDHGATNNTIQSCIIEGGNTNVTFSGTIEFGFNASGVGNSHNLIEDCDIRDRSDVPGVPRVAIVGESANPPNIDNTITRCNVFNWTDVGVLINPGDAATGWTISESSFYQTAPRVDRLAAISLGRGSGYQVLDNLIGGTAPGAGGAFLATAGAFVGIELTLLGESPRSSIQGNTIKNIRSSLPGGDSSFGVFLSSGPADIGNLRGNTVGSSNPDERFEVNGDSRGFELESDSEITLSNNSVINMTMTATPDPGQIYVGINASGTGNFTVTNNTVNNLTNTGTSTQADGGALIAGLDVESTGVQTIVGNTISNVRVSSTLPVTERNNRAWGIFIGKTAAGSRVEGNRVSNISGASPTVGAHADIITGLQSQDSANATYANNMITLDGGAASDRFIRGIIESSGTPTATAYLFNSVLIHGTATGANPTYAFVRTQNGTVTLRDNIFSNVRAAGTGFNAALANTTGTDGWTASASDYNLLFNLDPSHLTQWTGSAAQNNGDLAAFRTSTGGEMHSLNGDPAFISDADLHLSGAGIATGAGIPFGDVTTDIDGEARPSVEPDIGADEVINVPAFRLMSGSFAALLVAIFCLSLLVRRKVTDQSIPSDRVDRGDRSC